MEAESPKIYKKNNEENGGFSFWPVTAHADSGNSWRRCPRRPLVFTSAQCHLRPFGTAQFVAHRRVLAGLVTRLIMELCPHSESLMNDNFSVVQIVKLALFA